MEPTERFIDCRRIRKHSEVLKLAAVSDEHVKEVDMTGCEAMALIDDPKLDPKEWSRQAERIYAPMGRETLHARVPAATLNRVLSERGIKEIDLLVLDTEGSEADILRGLDMSKVKVRFALIEIHTVERKKEVESLLNGALLSRLSSQDYLYRIN